MKIALFGYGKMGKTIEQLAFSSDDFPEVFKTIVCPFCKANCSMVLLMMNFGEVAAPPQFLQIDWKMLRKLLKEIKI